MRYLPMQRGHVITSGFGERWGDFHWGTDFGWPGGSANKPVFACQGGTVTMVGTASGFGMWVVLDHPTADGAGTTVYGHVVPEVRQGQRVEAGQRIAHINPDRSTNGGVDPHLHLEVHRFVWAPPGNDRLDPVDWLENATHPGEEPPTVAMTAETLSTAMGHALPLDRYRRLLPAVTCALLQADCTTVDRAAMWLAQIGHESGGLQWMQELADGWAYEGRADLGNVFPGDGPRFKGHGPIQITGRHNHTRVSEWAYARGIVPTVTYFVDHPDELAGDEYGFVGVTWYWTVERNMNAFADAGDIYGATRAVNGGLNGIQDRIDRWNSCRALGAAILPNEGDDMPSAQEIAKAVLEIRVSRPDGREGETIGNLLGWLDQHVANLVDQVAGPGSKDQRGGLRPTGWPQLGGRSLVDALAALGEKVGAPGFKAQK